MCIVDLGGCAELTTLIETRILSFETPLKLHWNLIETRILSFETRLKLDWNSIETWLKLKSSLFKLDWNLIETQLKLDWNSTETWLKLESSLLSFGCSRAPFTQDWMSLGVDWVFRLVKDFSYEEEIHMLFAQRLESGPRNFIPSSGQPTWDSVRVSQVARGFVG
jgi:hypothetical protein